jgi:hypothetical protein
LRRECGVRAIVAGEDHDGVVAHAQFIDRVEQAADIGIHFGQAICKVPVAGASCESGIRQRRHMDERERDIGVERPARLDRALHEVDCSPDDLLVDAAAPKRREGSK